MLVDPEVDVKEAQPALGSLRVSIRTGPSSFSEQPRRGASDKHCDKSKQTGFATTHYPG